MAILKRIPNKQGDGAGRAPYALRKAIAVRTNIPSPLSLLVYGELSEDLKRELAKEFNRWLILHQGHTKTEHYVISFGHHLEPKEIEKVLDKIEERLFNDPLRYRLIAVHQEDHGTAFHVLESGDPEGSIRRSKEEYFALKRQVIKELYPFMNEREKEVAKHFKKGIVTQDWKHEIEVHAPERSFKEYIRQAVTEASELIRNGDIEKAIEFLESRGIEIVEKKAGEFSPLGRVLKRDRLYAVFNHPHKGPIAVRLDKKMKATFQLYLNAIQELERELKKAEGISRESESLRGGAPEETGRAPAEREGAPRENVQLRQNLAGDREIREPKGASKRRSGETPRKEAGAQSEDKHLEEGRRDLKQKGREFTGERRGTSEEIAGIEEVKDRERRIREELQRVGETLAGAPTEFRGERGKEEEKTKSIGRDSIADIPVSNLERLQPLFHQQRAQSTNSIQQAQDIPAQSTAKEEQGRALTTPEENRKSPKGTQLIRAEDSRPSEPNREDSPTQTQNIRTPKTAQLIRGERFDATSDKGLEDIGKRIRDTFLLEHSERLADFPLRGEQGRVEISGQSLRDMHSSNEVEMGVSKEALEEIKRIPPEKILSRLGIPYKQAGNRIMAQAIWRGEKNPSVSIQFKDGKWLWCDLGTKEGGDWIDLYRRITGSDFKEAVSTLMELSNVAYTPNISTREPNLGKKRKTSTLSPVRTEFEEIEKIPLRELQEPPKDLAEYLERKGFMPYWEQIKEIPELYYLRYRRGKKEYSGLATKTVTGSWIIKTKVTKEGKEVSKTYVSKEPSGLSLWRRDPSKVIVVEGFTDAMALAINPNFKDHSILILNGLGNLEKAIEMLKVLSPSKLYIALDLDEKGIEGRRKLVDEFPEARHIYFYGKDPAEYLSDKYAREHFPPFCEDWITSPFAPYTQLLPMYFEGGYLNKEILGEFSYEAYEMYLELELLDEEAERYAEEVSKFERYYLPEPEEDEPEEDRDRGISLDL